MSEVEYYPLKLFHIFLYKIRKCYYEFVNIILILNKRISEIKLAPTCYVSSGRLLLISTYILIFLHQSNRNTKGSLTLSVYLLSKRELSLHYIHYDYNTVNYRTHLFLIIYAINFIQNIWQK